MSEGLYEDVGNYEIYITGTPYGVSEYVPYSFFTLVSKDGNVAWMPDNEQQHVNPQPLNVVNIAETGVAQIIQQILLFKTKEDVSLESIIEKHKQLIKQILSDFRLYVFS